MSDFTAISSVTNILSILLELRMFGIAVNQLQLLDEATTKPQRLSLYLKEPHPSCAITAWRARTVAQIVALPFGIKVRYLQPFGGWADLERIERHCFVDISAGKRRICVRFDVLADLPAYNRAVLVLRKQTRHAQGMVG